MYIDFDLLFESNQVDVFVNRKRTNWSTYARVLEDELPSCPPSIENRSELDSKTELLTKVLTKATEKSCRETVRKGKSKPTWWNAEIAEKRKICRKLFNEAKKSGQWTTYKSSYNGFKNLIRKAKRESWRSFCSNVENSSETGRLRKILSTNPPIPSYIQRSDGSWTDNSRDTLELLLETHFPGCQECTSTGFVDPADDAYDISDIPISEHRIRWAVKSFHPFKSPGPDGIIPADLQMNIDTLMPWLLTIFRACLRLSHVPSIWTVYKIVFIPKGGKTSHTKAKDFRPISLSSFLLKTLERIIDVYIRSSLEPEALSGAQHAYTKGRSTETALHSLVGYIERSLQYREYTLIAFLDIEGAFNNVKPESVMNAMRRMDINPAIIAFAEKLLRYRRIESALGASNVSRVAVRGTPQGGVLSPLLWNLNLNILLRALESTCCTTIAYADDVAVAATGKDPKMLSELLESALKVLSKWCDECGLGVNPAKTELVLFTRRYKIPKFSTPKINGVALTLSDTARYLGIILDSKLNWNANTQSRITKAANALYCCKKAIGTNWGLNPRNVYWLYDFVVRPILFYGAAVWWLALRKESHRIRFERIMRMVAIMITGALRTTPTKALFAILNWLPPDLLAEQTAANTAMRLHATKAWKYRNYGHANISDIVNRQQPVDYTIPEPTFDPGFTTEIPERSFYENGLYLPGDIVQVFTDGSRSRDRVGCGIFSEQMNLRLSLRLPDYCSIIQAEIMAIRIAAAQIQYRGISDRNIHIITDSKAAIKTLEGVYTTSKLVRECRASLEEIARHSRVTLMWAPGHEGIEGNEIADALAGASSTTDSSEFSCEIGIPLLRGKQLISHKLHLSAEERWKNEPTCLMTRQIWPNMDTSRTKFMLNLNRVHLRNLISVITGHWPIGTHARRLKIPHNDFCRSCNDEEEEETTEHFLCHCPALGDLRMKIFGRPEFIDRSCLTGGDLNKIHTFVRLSGWLENGQRS